MLSCGDFDAVSKAKYFILKPVIFHSGIGATPRKLLPTVPVHLEVNKVIGHPSDVYPELFTQLLVGSYVTDMDGISGELCLIKFIVANWTFVLLEVGTF